MAFQPWRKTLTRRNCVAWRGRGRGRSWAGSGGSVPTGIVVSAAPPTLSSHKVATATASHNRAARWGSVMRVRCHCQPPRLVILNPCSIQARNPYQQASPALSLLNRVKPGIKTRKIALLAAPGSDEAMLKTLRKKLAEEGAAPLVIAPTLAPIGAVQPDATVAGMPSIMFDALILCGGEAGAKLLAQSGDARHFVLEAFKHLKAIAAFGAGRDVLHAAHLPDRADGVATGGDNEVDAVLKAFVEAAGQHRVWSRAELAESVPA